MMGYDSLGRRLPSTAGVLSRREASSAGSFGDQKAEARRRAAEARAAIDAQQGQTEHGADAGGDPCAAAAGRQLELIAAGRQLGPPLVAAVLAGKPRLQQLIRERSRPAPATAMQRMGYDTPKLVCRGRARVPI